MSLDVARASSPQTRVSRKVFLAGGSKTRPYMLLLCLLLFLWPVAGRAEDAPRRIVSIAPSFTEILFALGLDSNVVGNTNYCDYPPQALKTEKIGDVIHPNIEKIIALKPDLVLCGAWKWNVPEKLRSVGIHVVEIEDTESIQEILDRIVFIGETVGKKDTAIRIVSGMQQDLAGMRKNAVTNPRKVYMEIDSGNWTAGSASYLNEILQMIGLENIFRDRTEPYLMVTLESIIARHPDVVITLSRTGQEVRESDSWQAVAAVREGRLLDKNSMDWNTITRQSHRLTEGIARLKELVEALPNANR